jgi:transcriptional regulator with XRE-family HTH domain
MIEGFDFTVTPEEEAAWETQQEKRLALEDAQRRNAPSRPLHENLKALRAKFDLSQHEAAEIMGISERAYRTYEKGIRPVPSDALLNFATATGVDLNEMMLGRSLRPDSDLLEKFYSEIKTVRNVLSETYPKMDDATQLKIAQFAVTHDWRPFYHSLTDPELIRDAVIITTDYRFHPDEASAPPFWEEFSDSEAYEDAFKEWLALFGPEHPAEEDNEAESAK